MKKTLCIIALFVSWMGTAAAETYKVSSDVAFKTIIPRLLPGDMVLIADGNYTSWALDIPAKGTKENPIIIKASNKGKVVFSGDAAQSFFKFTGGWIVLDGIVFKACKQIKANGKSSPLVAFNTTQNCRLTNCTFQNNIATVQYTPLVVVSGNGTANRIDNCTFLSNIDNQEVQVKITNETGPTLTLIENNIFKDKPRVSWQNGNGGECVQIGQDPVLLGNKIAGATVQHNTFIHCDGENEVISNKSSGNRYINNKFEQNDGELVMRGGHDCIIQGNTFNGGTGGIRVNGTGHQIINNKIRGIKTAIRLMYGMSKGKEETGFYVAASNCIVIDNEISDASTGILIGDSKNADWTGKFDTAKYPSRVLQDIAPFNNKVEHNTFKNTAQEVKIQ